jgi:hypothetical protein
MKKITKKLSLNKQTMALLDEKEMMYIKGGVEMLEPEDGADGALTRSRLFCLLTKAEFGCTNHTSCKYPGGPPSGVVIACGNF